METYRFCPYCGRVLVETVSSGPPVQQKSLTMAIVLTLIPITDILGANWFYLGRKKVGFAKLALFLIYLVAAIATGVRNLGLILFFALVMTIWWLIDIPLVATGKIQPK